MRILFVCTGNTCRSPMAEGIFNKLCDIKDIEAISCGLSIFPFSVISDNTIMVLKESLDIDLSGRNAIQFSKKLFDDSDLVLTMTTSHKIEIKKHFNDENNKVYTICEFAGSLSEISDPYGMDIETYRRTFFELKEHIEIIIDKLRGINK